MNSSLSREVAFCPLEALRERAVFDSKTPIRLGRVAFKLWPCLESAKANQGVA